ncbi:MAG: sodium:solute symporter family protein [Gemmataceae bacterium]|nr:sodium:solute symporter family protein [Gemmataceae bacterium]MCI0739070.1 sodium:solute symporter family protein [Gemmataceae bacterium]
MGNIHWGGVSAVIVMYAAFLFVGWLAKRKVREGTADDLLVAGRSMPLWIAVMTMTATWVDGGYLLGTAEGAGKNLAIALQPGVGYGISLILGGLFFARTMRARRFTTLIDPFDARYGKRWSAVLFIPAMLGEVFWSASLLVAIGSTFQVILNLDSTTAILLSATVVTFYTMLGGMWSVAYTDAFQLVLIPIGLFAALPFAIATAGGLEHILNVYGASHLSPIPPFVPEPESDFIPSFMGYRWSSTAIIQWWDMTAMLVLGGIPWNCYFQRVLSCDSPDTARSHSFWAGVCTMALTIPPALLGMAALVHFASDVGFENLGHPMFEEPALALPFLLRDMVPYWIGVLGLGAIIGAVTSSFSSSILSAGSMFSWNIFRRLFYSNASVAALKAVIRTSIVLLGVAAVIMALKAKSVLSLWIFCSDLVFVLLFPQFLWALYDPRANRIGSITAFCVSFVLRLGGGEPIFELDPLISGWENLPFRTIAAAAGIVLLPVVSRLTARWDPPRQLENPIAN